MDEEITIDENVDEDGEITPEILKKLRERLKKCETEKADYLAGWQRAKADFINARKEEEENRGHFVRFSELGLILELLAILDSFDIFFNAKEKEKENISPEWINGVTNIHKLLLDILKKRGVEAIECFGKEFNPEEHESIGEIKVDNGEDENKIINEISKGYKMHGKVIRPSSVEVGKLNT
jgi:molecular chaperone GrpE